MSVRINVRGFTLIELLIAVAILGLLAMLAVPNFIRYLETANRNACVENLRNIQGAVQVWALDSGAASDAAPTTADLVPLYVKKWPACNNAEYDPSSVNGQPECPNIAAYPDHHQ